MTNFALYLLGSGLVLGLLLLPYRLWLANLSSFRANRVYLLSALTLSLILPFMASQVAIFPADFSFSQTELAEQDSPGMLSGQEGAAMPASGLESGPAAPQGPSASAMLPVTGFSQEVWPSGPLPGMEWICGFYLTGLAISLFFFFRNLWQLLRLILTAPRERRAGLTYVHSSGMRSTFSFFRWLIVAPQDRQRPAWDSIEAHEKTHIRQWHSLDILLADLAARIWWFLPWYKYLKVALRETHEYLADQAAARLTGPVAYSSMLLAQSLAPAPHLPVHFFARSKTQKRILMLTKSSSSGRKGLRYLLLMPVLGLSLFLVAFIPFTRDMGPEESGLTGRSAETALQYEFAGEPFPASPELKSGLADMIKRMQSKPELCNKLWFRGAYAKKQMMELLRAESIPTDFFFLALAESYLDPDAVSSMGACGIWQFLPATARDYGLVIEDNRDDRKDLARSTRAAAEYLKKYQTEFGSWTAATLAYNRGPGFLRKAGSDLTDPVTLYKLDHERGYLYRILAIKALFDNPADFGVPRQATFGSPLEGQLSVTSHFGTRMDPFDKKMKHHDGVDFKASQGTSVLAVADGVVKLAETSDRAYGNRIILEHASPLGSWYCHLHEMHVKPGQKVKKGDVIGTVGSTGRSYKPHLHFELREGDTPVNPALYFSLSM